MSLSQQLGLQSVGLVSMVFVVVLLVAESNSLGTCPMAPCHNIREQCSHTVHLDRDLSRRVVAWQHRRLLVPAPRTVVVPPKATLVASEERHWELPDLVRQLLDSVIGIIAKKNKWKNC